MMKFFRDLDHWWFGKGSPVALGLFRIFIGANALLSLVATALDFDAWYTERGYVPVWVANRYLGNPVEFRIGEWHVDLPRLSFLPDRTNGTLTAIFYFLVVVAALLTTVGLWTRWSSLFLAVGIVTLHHRNSLILHSGDTLMKLL